MGRILTCPKCKSHGMRATDTMCGVCTFDYFSQRLVIAAACIIIIIFSLWCIFYTPHEEKQEILSDCPVGSIGPPGPRGPPGKSIRTVSGDFATTDGSGIRINNADRKSDTCLAHAVSVPAPASPGRGEAAPKAASPEPPREEI